MPSDSSQAGAKECSSGGIRISFLVYSELGEGYYCVVAMAVLP